MANIRIKDKYIPQEIEPKWREFWDKKALFSFKNKGENYYCLVELPYPSGDLHLGHWFTFISADAHARYKKMSGRNVFFPNGFDAFGLPAENAAIKRGIHPKDWTMKNIETMKDQFSTMGSMIDWSHQAITCEPEYYGWNQWIFLKMFEQGLAYKGKAMSNWCPSCQTVLANEAIEDGKCWRCGTEVEQKEIEQWYLRITDYADDLIWNNTDQKISNDVDWPRSVREGQNNWIGKSVGMELDFRIDGTEDQVLKVFTTRPDTLYGATFMVVAPEHKIIERLIEGKFDLDIKTLERVKDYLVSAGHKTELERKEQKEKTGVFSGLYAINPINNKQIPIWVADYVLAGYGTGAIMAVPAHDERDYKFAAKYNLDVINVVKSGKSVKDQAYSGSGVLINSGNWDGIEVPGQINKIVENLRARKLGKSKIIYHLRDWSVSRQRYWGTPVPIVYCSKCFDTKKNTKYGIDYLIRDGKNYAIIPESLENLPVELPYNVDYTPKGKPPLATAEDWVNTKCPVCSSEAIREAETLDTFFDSSWYYYRYLDPHYTKNPFDPKLAADIMPVDIYFGGAEHTLGHTLYARFFTKFFKDLGLVKFEEFASKRIQHGVILGPDGARMSKSKGNVVNPDDVVKVYGTDTVRIYLSFMMPFEATAPWNPSAISGVFRFLKRIWQLTEKIDGSLKLNDADLYQMNTTIKKVSEDLDEIKFNTAISSLMEWLNYLSKKSGISLTEYKTLILLLTPFAPHFSEEVWFRLSGKILGEYESVFTQPYPSYENKYLTSLSLKIPVSVNGKVRTVLEVNPDEAESQNIIEKMGLGDDNVKKFTDGNKIKKVIYVKGKILNIVL